MTNVKWASFILPALLAGASGTAMAQETAPPPAAEPTTFDANDIVVKLVGLHDLTASGFAAEALTV